MFEAMTLHNPAWFEDCLINPVEREFFKQEAPTPDPIIQGPYRTPANPKAIYGDKKVRLDLVPPALEISAAHALGEGAAKYGAYKWRESGVEAMTYVGAIKRHLAAWVDGEELDPESTTGKHHLDGVAGSLAILLDCYHGGFLVDNRPAHGPGPRLVLTPKETI